MTDHNHSAPDLGSLYLGKDTASKLSTLFGVVGVVGTLAAVGALFSAELRTQALHSYLVGFFYMITIALGGLFFTVLQHLAVARWSVVVRRLSESMASTLPVVVLLFLPLAFTVAGGDHSLFGWTDPHIHDPAVQAKHAYLNVPFFLVRATIYLVVWGMLGTIFYRRSLALDKSGDPFIIVGLRRFSGPAMVLFGFSLTFAAFDWTMSLAPTWYSTIYGVYIFAGAVTSSLSTMILLGLLLRRAGLLTNVITIEHYHDLGKLLFGFIVFWTYIAFSQYFLIWYANIPEETEWFGHRWHGSWVIVSVGLALLHFAVPFFSLLSRHAKRSPTMLALVASLMLVMHYVDMYWLVMPKLHPEGATPHWLDVAAVVGTVGIFLAVLVRRLGSAPLIPAKDPFLQASMEFENV